MDSQYQKWSRKALVRILPNAIFDFRRTPPTHHTKKYQGGLTGSHTKLRYGTLITYRPSGMKFHLLQLSLMLLQLSLMLYVQ